MQSKLLLGRDSSKSLQPLKWQHAVRKKETKGRISKKSKKCFFCNKLGHIQKFCWQKIKCYHCGRNGHKFSSCFYKTTKSPPSPVPPHTPKQHQKNNQPNPDSTMELYQQRPRIGHIFCPPRLTLNEENDYLTTVGLIILIRGSPSPGLPRMIAAKMTAVHGGRPSEYQISEAMITPYLIICRNPQLRDAVVQHGLYSIPQTQTQFIVHEWRPRFGMGHDPSTHQVWVKIVGLPLQAWSTPEITQILQKFGHPLHILPFGRATGHYRDITALVATKHPSRIPLAYVYKEGDYSARVDIFILSWRLWEEGYFPPPGHPPCSDNPGHQPQQGVGPLTRVPRSPSSSSSTNTPSEPTIDLSSWSPRSHRARQEITQIWVQKSQHESVEVLKKEDRKHTPTAPTQTMTLLPLCLRLLFDPPSSSHKHSHNLATRNPTHISDTQQIYLMMHLYLLTVPRPIAINPFALLLSASTHNRTLGEAQGEGKLAAVQHRHTLLLSLRNESTLNASLSGNKSNTRFQKMLKEYHITGESPQKPTVASGLNKSFPLSQNCTLILAQPFETNNPVADTAACTMSPPTPDPSYQSLLGCFEEENRSITTDDADLLGPPGFFKHISDRSEQPDPLQEDQIEKVASSLSTEKVPAPQETLTSTSSLLQMTKGKAKGKQLATRRSQRLRQKSQEIGVSQKLLTEPRSKVAKISFDLHSHEIPLEVNDALTILQDSGLQIDKKIEDMIEEAHKKDCKQDQAQSSRPPTPLHDVIPPLIMPGDDFAL